MAAEDPGHPEAEKEQPGAPSDDAAERASEAEAPGPAPHVEDRLSRIEDLLSKFAERAGAEQRSDDDSGRQMPPTHDPRAADQALAETERLQRELEELAQSDPSFRSLLRVNEGLYNYFNRKIDEMRVEAQFERIADDEEREKTRKAFQSGDFRSVAAARRAVRGDMLADSGRREPERKRAAEGERPRTDMSVRGVPADEAAERRMVRDQYLKRVGDARVPMEERIRLRREREQGKIKLTSR